MIDIDGFKEYLIEKNEDERRKQLLMNCHLLGNKTSIVVDYEDEIIEYIGCVVKEKLEDGYVIEYSKEYSIQ